MDHPGTSSTYTDRPSPEREPNHPVEQSWHSWTSQPGGARSSSAAGGTFEGLFYRPTVLADVAPQMPAYASEIFGPVAPVVPFATPDEAAKLAADSEYGLSLGILTSDVMPGLDLARRIPTALCTSTTRRSTRTGSGTRSAAT